MRFLCIIPISIQRTTAFLCLIEELTLFHYC
uniref:Uncharacterized protein n=1 Tax=Myoviridae sp. ct9MV2 TaxID=2826625 RepID=A0A8S5NC96_9CAUD|nr:MAG TPA: hypothetical protein [Myoviridae sp. ct9MV2]